MPKKPFEIFKAIFDILDDGELKTVVSISDACKSSQKTIKSYIEMIEYIQSKKKLTKSIIPTKKRNHVVYVLEKDSRVVKKIP